MFIRVLADGRTREERLKLESAHRAFSVV